MIRTYRWQPDTCGCVITETHDDVLNVWSGIPEVGGKCPVHSSVADASLYGVLHANADGENKRKNLIHKSLLESFVGTLSVSNPDGTFSFKSGVSFTWSFSGSGAARVLTVAVVGVTLTTAQKNTLRSFCDTTFGTGKVVVS